MTREVLFPFDTEANCLTMPSAASYSTEYNTPLGPLGTQASPERTSCFSSTHKAMLNALQNGDGFYKFRLILQFPWSMINEKNLTPNHEE